MLHHPAFKGRCCRQQWRRKRGGRGIDERSKRRELRFLESEVLRTFIPQDLDTAISHALGGMSRARIRASELEVLWTCSNQILMRLVRGRELSGAIEGHTLWINLGTLREFLKQRLVS